MGTLIKKKQAEAESFQVDEATVIKKYGPGTKDYDVVEISVNGRHGTMMNRKSTKTYYILSGTGSFKIDDENYEVEAADMISVNPGSRLSIEGRDLRALIITNPPFDANDEEWA